MDFLDKVLEKLKDVARRVAEILLGPDMEPEMEPVPIPVRNREIYR
ncbi:hypothetical protein C1752_08632 [Acaryochloris thomasi RCC1774]|uniref:DNA topoisomerase I n=1 Tax=Acaryochloris thomasi RCC1774 TaxID=1764569 RepID=A0A2W1JP18_9CYAN|nr:DNA topoisomerase I [Acaryochloris thomasi]PZD70991.1 hypothetical protein C1752_08632 [Acaryochloris thomasi RCC1774]